MTTCPLEVTPAEYADIESAEAVVVREYERSDGSRFATVVFHGDFSECKDVAATPSILIVPVGLSVIQQTTVLVKDLLGP